MNYRKQSYSPHVVLPCGVFSFFLDKKKTPEGGLKSFLASLFYACKCTFPHMGHIELSSVDPYVCPSCTTSLLST